MKRYIYIYICHPYTKKLLSVKVQIELVYSLFDTPTASLIYRTFNFTPPKKLKGQRYFNRKQSPWTQITITYSLFWDEYMTYSFQLC